MKTSKLWISSTVQRQADAEELLRDFAESTGITGKDYQHLSLLTEETMGMIYQMLKDFNGEFWLESTPDGYEIILEAEAREAEEGAAVRQDAPEGFMSKIAEMLNCSYVFENAEDMPANMAGMLPDYIRGGIRKSDTGTVWAGRWSLSAYRQYLQQRRAESPDANIALDELEKSIVAQLSDDVMIGIQGCRIRLVIIGRLKNC